MKPSTLLPLWALLLSGVGCTLLIDADPEQCRSDADCARFRDAVCDLGRNICVAEMAPPDDEKPTDAGSVVVNPQDAATVPPHTEGGMMMEPEPDPCTREKKPLVSIEREIVNDETLTCDKDYLLVGTVFVKPGATLTIAPGTTIRGQKETKGTLVIQPGARLLAVGTPRSPIVFTSQLDPQFRAPGDWGGVILLGRAPVNTTAPTIEGITEGGEFGGDNPTDSSGSLKYVRIEYSGTKLGPNNEINGLTMGGVGSGTLIDYVQVRMTTDDCFEFFGGTVNAKHLVCQKNQDDGFDWDLGYRGKLQFLVLQQDPEAVDETNGFEGDNDPTASLSMPISNPTIYNATLCGKGREVDKQQYGMLLRKATKATIGNLIVSGFEAGLDLRDADTEVDLKGAVFFGNLVENLAYEENGSDTGAQKDDDAGFDEIAWLNAAERQVSVTDPRIDCFNQNALVNLAPESALTDGAQTPPADGFFDPEAKYLGAFKDKNDDWTGGTWIVWQAK